MKKSEASAVVTILSSVAACVAYLAPVLEANPIGGMIIATCLLGWIYIFKR